MQLTPDTLLHGGIYKIEKVLGQGNFGITYLAEHVSLGKQVAIKEFFMKELNSRGADGTITGMTDGSLSYNYCQKFQKEAINLSRLDHPNIVRVTDLFAENGTFYYVMDYIEGQNLNDYVKNHPLSAAESVGIIKDVAKALVYMHQEKHMLHLDLKPGNVMRRASDGHIFLIDFGLSKHYSDSGQPETSTTIGMGTAGYAPIEQANQAKNGEFRPTIDVYALGATLYKLLTRETPPAASDIVTDDELIEDNLRAKGISAILIEIVASAMRPSVRKRTPSVTDFLSSLNSCQVSPARKNSYNEPLELESSESTIIEQKPVGSEIDESTIIKQDSIAPEQSAPKPVVYRIEDELSNEGGLFNEGGPGSYWPVIMIIVVIVYFILFSLCGGGHSNRGYDSVPADSVADTTLVYDTDSAADYLPVTEDSVPVYDGYSGSGY